MPFCKKKNFSLLVTTSLLLTFLQSWVFSYVYLFATF